MMNVVVALHTFLTENNRETNILIQCDNLAAVQALNITILLTPYRSFEVNFGI